MLCTWCVRVLYRFATRFAGNLIEFLNISKDTAQLHMIVYEFFLCNALPAFFETTSWNAPAHLGSFLPKTLSSHPKHIDIALHISCCIFRMLNIYSVASVTIS